MAASVCKRLDLCASRHKPEAVASYMAESGTALLFIGGGIFVNVAILRLANEEAGCKLSETGVYTDCDHTVHGLRPSSVVAVISTIAGLCSAAFMPYAGAIIDYSSHRRTFGRAMAGIATLATLSLTLLSPSTWFPVAVVSITLAGATYYGHSLARWAYVREFVESDSELSGVVASVKFWQIVAQLTYLTGVACLTEQLGLNDLNRARVAQVTSSLVGAPLLYGAWTRFGARAPKHDPPSGTSLWLAGGRELLRTMRDLTENDEQDRGLRKLLLVNLFCSAPIISFTPCAVTYLTQQLGVPNARVALFAGIVLTSGVPGALVYRSTSRGLGHRHCLLLAIAWWILIIAAFAGALRTPDDQPLAILMAVPTGIGFGWIGPSLTSYLAAMMPPGREAELWGFSTFAQVCLTWLPPMLFTALNEGLHDMRLGMASLIIFFAVGGVIAWTVTEPSLLPTPAVAVQKPLGEDSSSRRRPFFDAVSGLAPPASASPARGGAARSGSRRLN